MANTDFHEESTWCPSMEGIVSDENRILSEEEQAKLRKQDETIASEFKQTKLEAEAQKNWDLFYKRNDTRFFRDRHWTTREFEQLASIEDGTRKSLLEIGCGVGNFIFPLLEENVNLFVHACDFSPRAVQFVKKNVRYDEKRIHAFVHDITKDRLSEAIPGGVDIASLIFVLSAIHPDNFCSAMTSIAEVLKPGGLLIFRDYGLYDMAQLRFGRDKKLGENFYVRQDGTRSYFFSVDYMKDLAVQAGLDVMECHYVNRRTINKKESVDELRVFVQGKFVKK